MRGERASRSSTGRSAYKHLVAWSFVAQLALIAVVLPMVIDGPAPGGVLRIALVAYAWTFPYLLALSDLRGDSGEAAIGMVIIGVPLLAVVLAFGYSLAFAEVVARIAGWRPAGGTRRQSRP